MPLSLPPSRHSHARRISDSSEGEILPQRSLLLLVSPPSLRPPSLGAILVGDQATPPPCLRALRACVRVMRRFSLIDRINLRDAYDPLRSLRSTILVLTFISHTRTPPSLAPPSQRPREKPASLAPLGVGGVSALDLIMSYIFPAAAMMERGSWSALL